METDMARKSSAYEARQNTKAVASDQQAATSDRHAAIGAGLATAGGIATVGGLIGMKTGLGALPGAVVAAGGFALASAAGSFSKQERARADASRADAVGQRNRGHAVSDLARRQRMWEGSAPAGQSDSNMSAR